MRPLVGPTHVFRNWSQEFFKKRDISFVSRTFAQSFFPRMQISERRGPRRVILFLQEIKGQLKRNGGVQLARLAQRERIVDKISTVRWTKLGVVVQQGSDDRCPHLFRISYAIKSTLIHVTFYIFHVAGYLERH